MGTWSTDSLGNDTAGDWADDLKECPNLSYIDATLDRVLASGDARLGSMEACRAIAAIETLARLLGRWGIRNSHTEDVDNWVESVNLTPDTTLALKAQRVLDRILTDPSLLLDEWRESGKLFEEWLDVMQDLRRRIGT